METIIKPLPMMFAARSILMAVVKRVSFHRPADAKISGCVCAAVDLWKMSQAQTGVNLPPLARQRPFRAIRWRLD